MAVRRSLRLSVNCLSVNCSSLPRCAGLGVSGIASLSSCKPIIEASECPHSEVGTPCESVEQEETMMVEIT